MASQGYDALTDGSRRLAGVSSCQLHFNGWLFSAMFAIAEGGNLATSIYAAAELLGTSEGARVYNMANFTLSLTYALGTLLAPFLVGRLGVKRALVISMSMYIWPALAWMYPKVYFCVPANFLEGIFGSVLWTAAGKYTAANAVLYSVKSGAEVRWSVSYFNNLFGGMFALVLAMMKLSAGLIVQTWGGEAGSHIVFAVGCSFTAGGALGMLCLIDFWDERRYEPLLAEDQTVEKQTVEKKSRKGSTPSLSSRTDYDLLVSVFSLMASDAIVWLNMPFNVLEGMVAALAVTDVTTRIKDNLGDEAVGYIWGISGIFALVFSLLLNVVRWKPVAIALGVLAEISFLLMLLLLPLDSWLQLVSIMCARQMGSVVWTGALSGAYAQYYRGTPFLTAAFATYKLQNGLGGAYSFMFFDKLAAVDPNFNIYVCLCLAVLSFPGFCLGHYLHSWRGEKWTPTHTESRGTSINVHMISD